MAMCCDLCSSVSSIVSTDDVSWSKPDESRLRQQLVRLRDDRSVVKLTIVDLESVHLDPFTCEPRQDACEAQKLDLENAVLMQELMAIKVITITQIENHYFVLVGLCVMNDVSLESLFHVPGIYVQLDEL